MTDKIPKDAFLQNNEKDENIKKKVPSTKEIINNAIKGLKFTKPSQRNHSSVHE